jgi:hypothetical protein
MFNAIAWLAGMPALPMPNHIERPMDRLLPQFSFALQCLDACGRSPREEYQVLIDAEKSEIAYWVGRDRWARHEYVRKLEMARDAWWYLETMHRSDHPSGPDWTTELRLNLGDAAYYSGAMPNFPWVSE